MQKHIFSFIGLIAGMFLGSAVSAADLSTQLLNTSGTAARSDSASSPKLEEATVEKNFNQDFEKADEAKKYDNSVPKISRFKIIGDKVVFEDTDTNRQILVYYDKYELHPAFDNIVRCSIRIYVLNDLRTRISSLGLRIKWPDITTTVNMQQVNPGVKTYTDQLLMGEGCLKLDKLPTLEINRCRVKGMSQEECADAVHWFPLNSQAQ